ncbi:MAG: hypothetical protein ACE5PO_04920 [Candidatus Bathyarchaeia archaeon]
MTAEGLRLSPRARLLLKKMVTIAGGPSEAEVLERIQRKKAEAGALLNDEGACFLVASELGVSFLDEDPVETVKIQDLKPGLNDVSLITRVLAVSPTREFTRSDGSRGRLRRMLVGDETGSTEVIVWGEKADDPNVESIREQDVVKLLHAYTRENLRGNVELHIGRQGQIGNIPPETQSTTLPPLQHYLQQLSQLDQNASAAHVRGGVVEVRPIKTFTRAAGEGRVARLRIRDPTGEVEGVFWDHQAEKLTDVKVGDVATILNAKVKLGRTGALEVHADKTAYVTLTPTTSAPSAAAQPPKPSAPPRPPKNIRDLTPGERGVLVEGVLLGKPEVRAVTLKDGSTAKVASVVIKDDTGEARLSAWRSHAEALAQLEEGAKVRLVDVSTKMSATGRVELVTYSSSRLETES